MRDLDLDRLGRLVGPTGLVESIQLIDTTGFLPPGLRYAVAQSRGEPSRRGVPGRLITSGGTSWDSDVRASFISLYENIERQCLYHYREDEFVWATASELGDRAMSLADIACFSPTEIARSSYGLTRLDSHDRIRWVDSTDLLSGRQVLVPAVMVYLIRDPTPQERFWLPFSTGAAVWTDPQGAMDRAACELIERECIAITWLQQISPPRIHLEGVDDRLRILVDWLRSRGARLEFYDITGDIAIPTVACLQLSESGRVGQTVGSACSTDIGEAMLAAASEAARGKGLLELTDPPIPVKQQFSALTDGARHMGERANRPYFDFLGSADRRIDRSSATTSAGTSPAEPIGVIGRVLDRTVPMYGVDITTREARALGLAAVKCVAPTMMPVSVKYQARYLGTPRLYDSERIYGVLPLPESAVNSQPIPIG